MSPTPQTNLKFSECQKGCVISALTRPHSFDNPLPTVKLLQFCDLCNCSLTIYVKCVHQKNLCTRVFSHHEEHATIKFTVMQQLVKETSWCYTWLKNISSIVTDKRFHSEKQEHCQVVTTPMNGAVLFSVTTQTEFKIIQTFLTQRIVSNISTDRVFGADRRMHMQ